MFKRIVNKRMNEKFTISIFTSFLVRGGAAFGVLLLYIVIGRLYGPEGVGLFALAQSGILGMAIISRGGVENALMSFVSSHYSAIALKNCIKFFSKRVAFKVIVFLAISLFFLSSSIVDLDENTTKALLCILMSLPFIVINFIIAGYFRGIKKTGTSFLLDNGIVSFLTALMLLLLSINSSTSLVSLGVAYLISTILVSTAGLILIARIYAFKKRISDNIGMGFCKTNFLNQSKTYFYISSAGFVQNVLVVLVLGFLINVTDLGILRSAERISMLIGFSLIIMNAIVPPLIIDSYSTGNTDKLKRYFKLGIILPVIIAAPISLALVLSPDVLSFFFGSEFKDYYWVLVLLIISQGANILSGASDYLLNIAGEHVVIKKAVIFMLALLLVTVFSLTPLYGIHGAAFSICITNVFYRLYLGLNAYRIIKNFE